MQNKRLIVILSSALVLAVAVAVIFLSPLGSSIFGLDTQVAGAAANASSNPADNNGSGSVGALPESSQANGEVTDGAGDSVTDGVGGDASAGAGGGGNSSGATDNGSQNAAPEQNQTATITCYVSIDCNSLVNNPNLAANKQAFVPASGWILGSTPVSLQAGQSVLDALRTATRDNGILMSTRGGYVVSIANLAERDCGDRSGWKFYVNGTLATVGSDSVKLKSGDSVNWTYVLDA